MNFLSDWFSWLRFLSKRGLNMLSTTKRDKSILILIWLNSEAATESAL